MKTSNVLCLAAACAALAGAASAATISPAGASFTARGAMSVITGGVAFSCTANITGVTAADGSSAMINSVAFTSGAYCPLWSAKNLPWTVTAASPTAMTIDGAAILAPPGNCPAGTLVGSWNNTLSKFAAVKQPLGDCLISMMFIPTPALNVAP